MLVQGSSSVWAAPEPMAKPNRLDPSPWSSRYCLRAASYPVPLTYTFCTRGPRGGGGT